MKINSKAINAMLCRIIKENMNEIIFGHINAKVQYIYIKPMLITFIRKKAYVKLSTVLDNETWDSYHNLSTNNGAHNLVKKYEYDFSIKIKKNSELFQTINAMFSNNLMSELSKFIK